LRIALYYPWIYLPGGPERTFVELLARSRHQWTLVTNHYDREATFPELKSRRVVELSRVSVKRSLGPVARAAARIATQRLPLEEHDALVIGCDGLGDLALLRNSRLPTACLCFTPLRAAFDAHYQEGYLGRNSLPALRRPLLKTLAAAYRLVDRMAWKRYDRVIAISEEVRKRIVAGGLKRRNEVDILYPGVDMARLAPSGERRREFLIAGRIMWTKNIELGIEAFRTLIARRPDLADFTLTIAGHVDRKSEPYIARLRALAADCPQIRFVTPVTDEQLFELGRRCYALLYTPFNEDWGLVPIETMALEKPVVAVDRGGPRETIVDGKTGYLVAPTPEAFADAMQKLADDERLAGEMGKAARVRAESFDWRYFAEGMDRIVDELTAPRRARAPVAHVGDVASRTGD
jgi:glycosyltransferase involved in cell wall biosynthesis